MRMSTLTGQGSPAWPAAALLLLLAGACGQPGREPGPRGAARPDEAAPKAAAAIPPATPAASSETSTAPAPVRIQAAPTPVPPERFQETASGLRWADIVAGEGASPKIGQRVQIQYTGWLESGRTFDSSAIDGQPMEFPLGLGQVIRGLDEGVATMRVGGRRLLVIPPRLAYGEGSPGGIIPAGATLTFEIELVGLR